MCEQEVQKIIHLQNIANQMPDAFTDSKRIINSHILAINLHIRIDVPKGPSISVIAFESQIRLKRGRPWVQKIRILEKKVQKMTLQNNFTKKFMI